MERDQKNLALAMLGKLRDDRVRENKTVRDKFGDRITKQFEQPCEKRDREIEAIDAVIELIEAKAG